MEALANSSLAALLVVVIVSSVCIMTECHGADGTCSAPAAAGSNNTLSSAERAQGYELLFDGSTLRHWLCTDPDSKAWVIDNGTIFCRGEGGGYLYTAKRHDDFEMKIDFMVDRGANSGLFVRWDDLSDPVQTGIEVQILDTAAAKVPGKYDSGAIYDCLAPSVNAMKPALQWNSLLLRCRRNMITVTMNGKRIIQMDLDKWTKPNQNPDGTGNKYVTAYKDMPREGHVGLQNYGDKVWFRNAKIRTLK